MQCHLYLATITAIYRIQQEKQDAIGAYAWESENLLTFFGTARKPLSTFDNRLILKEYPRPNVDLYNHALQRGGDWPHGYYPEIASVNRTCFSHNFTETQSGSPIKSQQSLFFPRKRGFPRRRWRPFCKGFESRLKERTKAAVELSEAKKVGHQNVLSNPLRVRFFLARGGSWNKGRRGALQGCWQTRTRPYQPRGKCYLPSPSETSSKQ